MFRSLIIGVLLASWAPTLAVEWREDPSQAAREARALHSAAQAARDIWTCLMIEGWFYEHPELRPIQPLLGRGAVLGNPWLAFPENLHSHWLRQRGVGAIAGRLFFLIDDQGRPLRMPLHLPFSPQRSGLSHDGSHVGIARLRVNSGVPQVQIAIFAEPGPGTQAHQAARPAMEASVGLTPLLMDQRSWLDSSLRVSADGSGAAIATNYSLQSRNEVHLIAEGRRIEALANCRNPQIVGPGARWVICEDMLASQTSLIRVGQRRRLTVDSHAGGPGIAVVRHDGQLHMVATDGQANPWQPRDLTIGRNPDAWNHGPWLVVGSGHDAQREPIHDMFGNPVTPAGPAPYRLAIYRWQDLLGDANAAPVLTVTSPYINADNHYNGLLQAVGDSVQLIDLNGKEPVTRELISFDRQITSVRANHHHYVASLDDDQVAIFSPDATQLWRGPAQQAWVQSRRHVLIDRHGELLAVTLDADPEARREVTITPAPSHPVHIDGRSRFISSGHLHREDYQLHDPDTGRLIEDEQRHQRLASLGWYWRENDSRGAFYRQHGRLIPKARGTDNRPAPDHWCPQDAWLLRNRLMVLDHDGWVYVGDSSGSSFHTQAIMAGDQFRSLGDQRLWVAHMRHVRRDADNRTRRWELRAAIDRRGDISHEWIDVYHDTHRARFDQVAALPDFNWRQSRDRFVIPPRSEMRRWDGDGLGWTPSRFRGQEGTMLLITPSIILAPSRSHLQALTVRDR